MTARVNPWLVLVLVCLAQFMVILDATIVNVALPTIQQDLDMSDTNLQWVVNAYTLCSGASSSSAAGPATWPGGRKSSWSGSSLFTSASLLCAVATGSTWLIVSRDCRVSAPRSYHRRRSRS